MLESMRSAGHLRLEDNDWQEMDQSSKTAAGKASMELIVGMVWLEMGGEEMALLTLLNKMEELILLNVSAKLSVGEVDGMVCDTMDEG